MNLLVKILESFSYRTRSLILMNSSQIYAKLWPPAFDIHRKRQWNLEYSIYSELKNNVLQPGDIILRRTSNTSVNLFIEGRYSHVGLYLGSDKQVKDQGLVSPEMHIDINNVMFHMIPPYVKIEELITYIQADEIQVWRKKGGLTIEEKNKIRETCSNILDNHVPYDFDYNNDDKALYCSEGVVDAYEGIQDVNFVFGEQYGKKVYVPSTFVTTSGGFELIYQK